MAKPVRLRQRSASPIDIGWAECLDLPDLGLNRIRAKIDSGAATSSIHATRIKPVAGSDPLVVEFWFRAHKNEPARKFRAPAVELRRVKSSNGQVELRYVIETTMILGNLAWKGHLTLANRTTMAFPILVGRRALRRGFRIDCARKWVLGAPEETDR